MSNPLPTEEAAEDLRAAMRRLIAGLDTRGIRPFADDPPSMSWVLFCLDGIDKLRRAADGRLPRRLHGDGPCQDCGGANIIWFADNVLWNRVMGGPDAHDDPGGIVCVTCFVRRVDDAGLAPRGWRLVPDWHWETCAERSVRELASEGTRG